MGPERIELSASERERLKVLQQVELRGVRVEIEGHLDGSHWLRFRGRYLLLHDCPAAPTGSAYKRKPEHKYIPSPDHPWRKPWKRTFLLCTNRTFLLCVDTLEKRSEGLMRTDSASAIGPFAA
jgi:hypothetical protein